MKNIAASVAGAAIVLLVLAQASGAHERPLAYTQLAVASSPRPTPVATVSRGPVPPPTPSLPTTTTFGAIGALERNPATQVSALDPYLADHDPAVQTRAVLALGRLGNPDALGELTTILEDRRRADQVRAVAAFSIGLFASPSSLQPLEDATRRDAPVIAAAATGALGRIGGATVVDILTQLLSDRDAGVRAQAAVGLGEVALPGAPAIDFAHRQAAANALTSSIQYERDQEVRWREAWALSRAFYQNAAPILRRMLTDDQELVRLYGVSGLRRLGDRSYALPIRLLADDPSWRVRWEVHYALVALRDPTRVNLKPPEIPLADKAEPVPVASSAPAGDHPQVAIVTNKGVIVLELFPDAAPYSVDNFLSLVDRGFYNGLTYFRVISDFVVQGGDPKNTGDGGPGYSIPAELNPLEQLTGIISYGLDYDTKTNTPLINSAGSQYYITQSPQLHLDRAFTVFGRVVKGMSVVDNISDQPDAPRPAGIGPPDVAKRVYRCEPVTPQTDEVERKLRTAEIGYDAR
ncbi:MAG: peptidylprolyl isomerase [Candidatus Eremiobacteraeota bacterium]|nr:peptidylprolyl isomerase [Candidatus Eremiobacteraeota bacterium]